jgi:glycosyltransferase involved in cell wall biosynthesis
MNSTDIGVTSSLVKVAHQRTPDQKCLPVTVLVPVKDEELNIGKCLLSLTPAARIVLVDSASTDSTVTIAQAHGAEIVDFFYAGGYPKKRQWALDNLGIETPWTMLVDADEQITPELWEEIGTVVDSSDCVAYLASKEFHFMGQRFRFGGFSHSAVILFRTGHARFEQTAGNLPNGQDMEVHERMIVDGKIGRLSHALRHNDYKGLYAYLDRHNKYSTWEAGIRMSYLETGTWGAQTIKSSLVADSQSIRRFIKSFVIRFPGEPWLWFLYHYFFRGGFLEGRRGYIAASIRKAYIEQVRAKMFEMRIHNPSGH